MSTHALAEESGLIFSIDMVGSQPSATSFSKDLIHFDLANIRHIYDTHAYIHRGKHSYTSK